MKFLDVQFASVEADRQRCSPPALFRLSLLIVALGGTAPPAITQHLLWDHYGNVIRDELSSFDVLGDVNGDGVDDLILGSVARGSAIVRSGATGEEIATQVLGAFNNQGTDFGRSVANVGLIDGDGVTDYAVGAPDYTPVGTLQPGLVRVYSGASHQELYSIVGQLNGEGTGYQVMCLGDVNGDGLDDFGTIGDSAYFRIFSGPDGSIIRTHTGVSLTAEATAFGDHDGDGYDDYLVGYGTYGGNILGAGRVRLHSGKDGSPLVTIEGEFRVALLGTSVSPAGDWNGDGIGDIAAGRPTGWGGSADGPSGACIYSGRDGALIKQFIGEDYCRDRSQFGRSLSSGKDVNGDGFPDLLVSARHEPYYQDLPFPPEAERGSVFLFSGATGGLLWEHVGREQGFHIGTEVELIDDFNGDGLADWAILSTEHGGTDGVSGRPGRLSIFGGAFGDATSHCQGGLNSTGARAVLWNSGPISVSENRLELVASEMPQATAAVFFHGRLGAPTLFGAGELCLTGPMGVLDVSVSGSSGPPGTSNNSRILVDLDAPPFTGGGHAVGAGDTWAFQVLYREQGVRNTSNALEVKFVP